MILTIDVGNTQTVFGLFKGDELLNSWRALTPKTRTSDEIAALIYGMFSMCNYNFSDCKDVVISTVVPRLREQLYELSRKYFHVEPLIVEFGIKTGLELAYENPREVGADRIANSVAASNLFGPRCVVVDFGTATTFDIIDNGNQYLGGVIVPGVEISAEALFSQAAKLMKVELRAPSNVIGKNTEDSIRSGIIFGYAGLVDHLAGLIEAEMSGKPKVISTGGLAHLISPHSRSIEQDDPDLTLKGLKFIHELNR